MAKNGSISYMLTRFVTLFVLLCGTWFVIRGSLSYGEFVAFVLLTNVLFRPIDKINAIIEMYPRGIAGFKSYMELMETEPDIQDSPDSKDVSGLKGNIRYKHVSFGYDGHHNVLNDINLSIQAGKRSRSSVRQVRGNQRFAVCFRVFMKHRRATLRLTASV